jgi:hypothetical protein
MAKESGLGATVSVDDSGGTLRDISNDVTDFTINTPRAEQNVTGVDKSANERLQLLADGAFTLNGVYNDAANKSHAVFKDISSTSVIRTVTIAISGQSLSMEMILGNYNLTRSATGDMTWSVPCALADGTVPTWS